MSRQQGRPIAIGHPNLQQARPAGRLVAAGERLGWTAGVQPLEKELAGPDLETRGDCVGPPRALRKGATQETRISRFGHVFSSHYAFVADFEQKNKSLASLDVDVAETRCDKDRDDLLAAVDTYSDQPPLGW